MITILVDESYAFDYLAILEIKLSKDANNRGKKSNFIKCKKHIKNQIGPKFFDQIYNSSEYKQCYKANLETYNAVHRAKKDTVLASYVDKCNYKRFLAKKDIQDKFFDGNTTEIKIGYEIYKGN